MSGGPPVRTYTVYVDEELPEVREDLPWAIRDLQTADWALRRLGRLKAQKEEIDGQYEQALELLRSRREALLGQIQKGIDFFTTNLVAFTEINKRQILDGKARSRNLLHGKIGFRKQPARLKVVDEAVLIEWAKRQPLDKDLLRYTPSINKEKLNDYFKTEGIIPDGCELEAERDNVYVHADAIPDTWATTLSNGGDQPGLPAPGNPPGGAQVAPLRGPGEGTG